MENLIMLDENTGFVADTPVIVPIRWRYKQTLYQFSRGATTWRWGTIPLAGSSTYPGRTGWMGGSPTDTAWVDGGVAQLKKQACSFPNFSSYWTAGCADVRVYDSVSAQYKSFGGDTHWLFWDTGIEIDFEATMAALRASYDSQHYTIGAIRFCDSSGDNSEDLVKEGFTTVAAFNAAYKDESRTGQVVARNPFGNTTNFTFKDYTTDSGGGLGDVNYQRMQDFNIKGYSKNDTTFNDTVHALSISCATNSRNIPMYLKVFVGLNTLFAGGGAANPDTAMQTDDKDKDPDEWSKGSGGAISGSGLGSGSSGMNSTYNAYGNSLIRYDSVYMVGSSYNSFVTAGGGIVGESGVFPNSATFYIDKIRLSLDGSTMTLVEVAKFDATPSLALGEKIYGYILDATNTTKPAFCGYVISQQRRINSGTQEIVYECRDLVHFLKQLYTPSYYIYRPSTNANETTQKTYDRILKEILNEAGIQDAIVTLPIQNAPPTEWIYQDIESVLEWALKYFGKYVYFVDRYGRLNINATDGGSFIKNIAMPAEGTAVGSTYKVLSFEPITDYSRARSRIILTGDFEVEEHTVKTTIKTTNQDIDPSNAGTGVFYYTNDAEEKIYYLKYKPGKTLASSLPSLPGVNAKATFIRHVYEISVGGDPGWGATVDTLQQLMDSLLNHNYLNRDMSITQFSTEPGNSFILIENVMFVPASSSELSLKYATVTDSPIQVSLDTGYTGGIEIIRRPEFKKITSSLGNIDDTQLMTDYLNQLASYYKPIYGGNLELDGLDTDLVLLGKVSITGTTLPAVESSNLIIYGIEYDIPNKRTTVELSNKVYADVPYFDDMKDRTREKNELLARMGIIEQENLYNRV